MTPDDRAASLVIEAARAVRGMSKAELSRRAGISLRTVNYYLAGEHPMTYGTFVALCGVLGVERVEAASRVGDAVGRLGTPTGTPAIPKE